MATQHEDQLYKMFGNVNEWLKFAEAKNFGLLTLNAAIVFGFTQITFGEQSIIKAAGYYVFFPFAFLSFMPCLISLFPIVSKIDRPNKKKKAKLVKRFINRLSNWIDQEAQFENIHFYGYLKDLEAAEFEIKFLEKIKSTIAFTGFEKDLTTQILYNSRITWLKYQLFKIGAFIFLAGSVAFVVALLIFQWFFN